MVRSHTAPLFAAAFATQNSWKAFLVGLAASIGAGNSMGFAESPIGRRIAHGARFSLDSGCSYGIHDHRWGIGHTLPFLISDFHIATIIAVIVVVIELGAISYIRYRYMDTPFWQAAFSGCRAALLVFLTGWLIAVRSSGEVPSAGFTIHP